MPNKTKDVKEFFERLAVLETKVAELMRFNKWQMGVLAAILIAVLLRGGK